MESTDALTARAQMRPLHSPIRVVRERETGVILELGDDGVDLRVDPLDAREVRGHQLARRKAPRGDQARQLTRAREAEVGGARRCDAHALPAVSLHTIRGTKAASEELVPPRLHHHQRGQYLVGSGHRLPAPEQTLERLAQERTAIGAVEQELTDAIAREGTIPAGAREREPVLAPRRDLGRQQAL